MKIKPTELCTFCNMESETIIHLFWECPIVKNLITNLKESFRKCDVKWNLDCKSFILGTKKEMHLNMFCLEIKRYIFLCKKKGIVPTIQGLKCSFQFALSIIKCTERKNDNYSLIDKISKT